MKRLALSRLGRLVAGMTGLAAGLATLCGAAMLGSPARADDLYGWRGFYVGASGNLGLINQDIKFKAINGVPNTATGTATLNGFGGTLLTGYRIPIWSNAYRIGLEVDFTAGDNAGGFNGYRFVSDFNVNARGTFGVFVRPDLLWFGTAGVGWMGINSETSQLLRSGASASLTEPEACCLSPTQTQD